MAVATMTPSRMRYDTPFTTSLSQSNSYSRETVSMADSLPSINFGFEELRERMALFTARFDDFIERGRKRVLEERNQFRLNVAEIQESQRARKRDIENIENRTIVHQNNLAKEQQEQEEMHEAIEELSTRREDHLSRRDELKVQITELQNAIKIRRQAQQQHQQSLDHQARHNGPELQFWESSLCLRIEGMGVEDKLRFIYTHIDERMWDRECWFELNMGKMEYEVLSTEPALESDAVQAVLDRLNETRELSGFLKGLRGLFVEAIRA